MFGGECCAWLLAVMVAAVEAGSFNSFPVKIAILLETDKTDQNIVYEQALAALKYTEIYIQERINRSVEKYAFIYRNISCDGDGTAAVAAELHCKHTIGVFIGPACSGALNALLPLAKSWNIAVITPVGSGISDSSLSKMVTKLSPYSVWSHIKAMKVMLTKYKWYNVAIIFDEEFTESAAFTDGLFRYLRNGKNWSIQKLSFKGSVSRPKDLSLLLVRASDEARVFILACQSNYSRTLLLEAYHLGYATSGEYVFFIIDELSKVPDPQYWQMGQPDDKVVLAALGNVIWPYINAFRQDFSVFRDDFILYSYYQYGYDYNGSEVSSYLYGYMDAYWIYGNAVNETLLNNEDPLNGTTLTTNYLWNKIFYGFAGQININECGFRQNNVTFSFFNITTGRLEIGDIYNYTLDKMENISNHAFDWPYSGGNPPPNIHPCGFKNNICLDNEPLSNHLIGTIAGLLALVVVTGFIGAVFMYRGWKSKQTADLWWWKIPSSDLVMTARNDFSSMYLRHSKYSLRHGSTLDNNSLTGEAAEVNVAIWKGQTVGLRRLPLKHLTITKAVLMEFKQLRDVNHSNLARIFGACFEDSLKVLVTERCTKGSLQDLLGNMRITMDAQFKFSLCKDIIDGLCYIHQSPIHQHGRLNSNVCLIDNRFSVKLTDFGLPTLYSNVLLDVTSDEFKNECTWKAPEILRSGSTSKGTMEGDIYSYGMILLEIITQDFPFATETAYMTTDEILQKVQNGCDPPFRPATELPQTLSSLKELIQSCWEENPKSRPSCQFVRSSIKQISISLGDSGNLMENLMRRMELYANNLEKMVEEKTAELMEEKKKSEELLYQILPRSVANRLKSGLRVDPEVYEGVSIYFSDIVGFTEISAVSSPMQVVDLLNDIYSCFDAIIEEFDVYKVETIGDAYMVVSGLPQRNGNLHALNIARMSIKVLETIREFKIRHRPTETVQIRIGLHSGPVCAGVVGSKMPRYCLFGDTVNTASRMESSGKAMMIHISPSTKTLLDQFGSFHVLPRGDIAVKGKGDMFTYWLLASHDGPTDLVDGKTYK